MNTSLITNENMSYNTFDIFIYLLLANLLYGAVCYFIIGTKNKMIKRKPKLTIEERFTFPKGCKIPFLLGLSAKISCGKNWFTEEVIRPWMIKMGFTCIVVAFADELKFFVMGKNGFTFEEVFITKPTKTRIALQEEGEAARQEDEDRWIEELHKWIMLHGLRGVDVLLFADARHKNEAKYIKHFGGVMARIDAPLRARAALEKNYTIRKANGEIDVEATEQNINKIANHISETALDDYTGFNFRINNEVENEKNSPNEFIEQLSLEMRKRKLIRTK